MEQKLREDLKQAQLDRDEVKVSTLRLLLSELTYAKVAKGTETLSDEDIISAIQKEAKKRKESIESQFRRADSDPEESDVAPRSTPHASTFHTGSPPWDHFRPDRASWARQDEADTRFETIETLPHQPRPHEPYQSCV